MKLRMRHVPNPDIPAGYYNVQRYEGHPVEAETVELKVETLAEASAEYRYWINACNLGGGNIPSDSGTLTDANGDVFARVSFNGRVWGDDGQEMYNPAEGYMSVTMKF